MQELLFSVIDFSVKVDGEFKVIDLDTDKNIQVQFKVIPRNILFESNELKDYSLVIDLVESVSERLSKELRTYRIGLLSYESDFNAVDNSSGVYEITVDIPVEEIKGKMKQNEMIMLDSTDGRSYTSKIDIVLRSFVDKRDYNNMSKDVVVYFNLPLSTDSGWKS